MSDIVQSNMLAMERDTGAGDSFNIGIGRPVSVRDVARVLSVALDKEIEPAIVGKFREGDIRHCIADIPKARNILGYEPHVSFEQGIRELCEWVKRQPADDRVEGSARELERRGLVQ